MMRKVRCKSCARDSAAILLVMVAPLFKLEPTITKIIKMMTQRTLTMQISTMNLISLNRCIIEQLRNRHSTKIDMIEL